MAKKPTLLESISKANADAMIRGLTSQPEPPSGPDVFGCPSRKLIKRYPDEDLLELIAAKPSTREAEIARSIMREREAWRTPAKWSMIIAIASLVIATWAFVRTL